MLVMNFEGGVKVLKKEFDWINKHMPFEYVDFN